MPIFDPKTKKVIDREALMSVGINGSPAGMKIPRAIRTAEGTEKRPWQNDNDGGLGGIDTHHDDGRIDVNVLARPGIAGGGSTQSKAD